MIKLLLACLESAGSKWSKHDNTMTISSTLNVVYLIGRDKFRGLLDIPLADPARGLDVDADDLGVVLRKEVVLDARPRGDSFILLTCDMQLPI